MTSAEALFAKQGKLNTDSGTKVVRVDPTVGGSIAFGNNRLVFGPGAVCDIATSGYGVDTWDMECVPATEPFDVTVVWGMYDNRTWATFAPDLRFVASSDKAYWAYLTLFERQAELGQYYNIWWRGPDGRWIDESKADSTLAPWTNQQRNEVTRRLRHLSGYWVGVGFCDESCNSDGFAGGGM